MVNANGCLSGHGLEINKIATDRLKFLTNKIAIDNNGCWIWTGNRTKGKTHPKGYGRISYGKHPNGKQKMVLVHKFMYALTVGNVPEGMNVLHSCDNPPCCNPAHLKLGTHQDNVDDREAKGRNKTKDENGVHFHARLNWEQVREIRKRAIIGTGGCKGGSNLAELAKEFNIGRGQILNIAHNKSWRE